MLLHACRNIDKTTLITYVTSQKYEINQLFLLLHITIKGMHSTYRDKHNNFSINNANILSAEHCSACERPQVKSITIFCTTASRSGKKHKKLACKIRQTKK